MCKCLKLNNNLLEDLNLTSAIIYKAHGKLGAEATNSLRLGILNFSLLNRLRIASRYVKVYKRLVTTNQNLCQKQLYLLEKNLKYSLKLNLNLLKFYQISNNS